MDGARLLGLLWDRYAAEVPHARTFVALAGGRFANDHVAFRSLAKDGGGIAMFAPLFERLGWRRAGSYRFPDAHLRAIHLEQTGLPRIFVSELDATLLSPAAQALLGAIAIDPDPPSEIAALADWFAAPASPVDGAALEVLAAESQYAAWLLAYGRKVNHFTASVDDIEAWQARLIAAGVPMKREIEGAPHSVLRQTATEAVSLPVALVGGGVRAWPYAYLEIAERAAGFEGFLGPQARQLFEMTRR